MIFFIQFHNLILHLIIIYGYLSTLVQVDPLYSLPFQLMCHISLHKWFCSLFFNQSVAEGHLRFFQVFFAKSHFQFYKQHCHQHPSQIGSVSVA